MRQFPFVSLSHSLIILRVATAVFFMAHAAVRITHDTTAQFALFFLRKGFPFPLAWVWGITVFEIIGGALLIFGIQVRALTVGFQAICWGGIILIHAKLGWFVGEHGTGGVEYSLCLSVALLVLAAVDREGYFVKRKK